MGVVSFQFVLTLIGVSILRKMQCRKFLGLWLLSKSYVRYAPPADEELIKCAQKVRPLNRNRNHSTKGVINIVKCNLNVDAQPLAVTKLDLCTLPFCQEFLWMIDFACVALFVFVVSECFALLFPNRAAAEINLSIVWLFLLASICLKLLFRLTAIYFKFTSTSGERSICIAVALVSFYLLLAALLFNERVFDVQIKQAYDNLSSSVVDFYAANGLQITPVQSPLWFYINLAVLFAALSTMFAFPSIRLARMYRDALRLTPLNICQTVILHLGIFGPCCCFLWCRPVVDRLSQSQAFLSRLPLDLESFRVALVLLVVLVRLLCARPCLQAYLNLANHKIATLRKESGRITNCQLSNEISSVFTYYVVVASQFYGPALFLLSVNCLLKALGKYSWLLPSMMQSFHNANRTGLWKSTHLSTIFNVSVNRSLWNLVVAITCALQMALTLFGLFYTAYVRAAA